MNPNTSRMVMDLEGTLALNKAWNRAPKTQWSPRPAAWHSNSSIACLNKSKLTDMDIEDSFKYNDNQGMEFTIYLLIKRMTQLNYGLTHNYCYHYQHMKW